MPANSSRCEGKVEASGAAKTNRIVHPIKSSLALRQQKYKWRARFRTELSRHCCPISGYARRRFSRLRAQSGRGNINFNAAFWQKCLGLSTDRIRPRTIAAIWRAACAASVAGGPEPLPRSRRAPCVNRCRRMCCGASGMTSIGSGDQHKQICRQSSIVQMPK